MGLFKEKNFSKNQSFTLLELIIVIIIVGVLSALAIPRFFKTIERSRATEAMLQLDAIGRAFDRCLLMNGADNYAARLDCRDNFIDYLGEDPNENPIKHFLYSFGSLQGSGAVQIMAGRNFFERGTADPGGAWTCPDGHGGSSAGSGLVLCIAADGSKDIVGYGLYQ